MDYMNAITTYREVSAEEDDAYLESVEEDNRRYKRNNPTEEELKVSSMLKQ
jgi:hypothetical protein